jgi:GTP cyclohydrolase II
MTNSNPLTVTQAVGARIPTQWGEFQLYLYQNNHDQKEHLAFVYGEIQAQENILVRVHSECFTGDVLGSQRCDCGEQLEYSLCAIANHGTGVLIYLRQEGRGIGLAEKLRAYNLQDQGFDTVEANIALGHQADIRDYSIAAAILEDIGIHSIQLLTNNPAKIENLTRHGIHITQRVSIQPTINSENLEYLKTKVDRMQHLLTIPEKIAVETRQEDEGCR